MKLSTINQIVEGILEELGEKSNGRMIANEAVIYYKTAMICELKGIDEAMKYYLGIHSENEFQEFRTSVVAKEHKEYVIMEAIMSKIDELKFDDKNFNKHTEYGMSLLEKSLRENGAGRSILLDKDNNIIAGNGIIEAAGSVGLENVKIVESDGTEIIAVKRTDVRLNSKQGRKMALADNATAKADLEWDFDNIMSELTPEEARGWGVDEIKTGLDSEKKIEDREPSITSSFITFDYSDEIELKITNETAEKLMSEMIKYREENGNYDGFWDERLK